MHGVPQEERHDEKQKKFHRCVLREGKHVRIAHRIVRQQHAEGDGDAADEYEHRADQGRHHASGAEERPENRSVRAFHRVTHKAMRSTATEHTTATMMPVAEMVEADTYLPPTPIGGLVVSVMLN